MASYECTIECICICLGGVGQSLKMALMQSRDTVNTKCTWMCGVVGVANIVNTQTSDMFVYHCQVLCTAQSCLCCTFTGPAAQ